MQIELCVCYLCLGLGGWFFFNFLKIFFLMHGLIYNSFKLIFYFNSCEVFFPDV